MLKIWGRASSMNVQKVLWAADELGLSYERVDAGGKFGGLDTPAYHRLNPNARIPTIEDDGAVIWESNAIVRYLAARYGEGQLWDKDPGKRGAADQWMDWMQTTLAPDFYGLFWAAVRTAPQRQEPQVIREFTRRVAQHYGLVEEVLTRQPFLAGDSLTVADIPVGATLHRYYEMAIERPALPHLRACYERLGQRPAYRKHVMVSFEELRGR